MFQGLILLAAAATSAPHAPTAAQKTAIMKIVGEGLKDAQSAKYRWLPMQKADTYCGFVNAKNSFGGYAGFQPFQVLFLKGGGGTLPPTALIGDSEAMASAVTKVCTDAGYDMGGG